MRRSRTLQTLILTPVVLAALIAACSSDPGPKTDAPPTTSVPEAGGSDDAMPDHVRIPFDGSTNAVARVAVKSELVSSRVDVQKLLFAAGEMQISGEPFAQGFAGRNLGNYDRTYLPTDQYILDNGGDNPVPITDLFGYSTAVESYEYSKYHMNMICQQSSAGLSLAAGPIVAAQAGASSLERLRARASELMTAAGTDISGYAILPPPENNPMNYLGFQGLWPNFAPFRSFDPAMEPHDQVVKSCTFAGGYGGIPTIGATIPEYECAYNSLHLTDREKQVEKVLSPGVIGMATWKEALWSIDFSGRIHDAGSNPVDSVADEDRANVGIINNLVKGTSPATAARGTYLGSNPLEGMWGLTMLSEMDNAAELLATRMTTDGKTLGSFASRAAATAYDYDTPLRWFPTAVNVTEGASDPYPAIASMTIADAGSRADDLAALLLGHSMFFGMTDARNAGIGQLVGLSLTFDGDPFPVDHDALGEDTAHDRALAVLRIAFVDLDRMHTDPTLGVSVDTATVDADTGTVKRGNVASTTSLAHVVIALRQTLLSLNGAITQYGAADPDPAADAKGALNVAPIHPVAGGGKQPLFSERVRSTFVGNAKFVRDVLTKPTGEVANGATIEGGKATAVAGAATIESQSAAVRALVEGFLVTGDESYRDRARAVARRMEADFYSAPARMFRGLASGKDEIHMGPETFAWLQSALRETHKVLHVPGDKAIGRDVLEDRIARVNKLFLNGWDDLDGNEVVTPEECLAGRLQLGEQALTGELGRDDVGHATSDRDGDCVPEIDDAKTGSVMPREVFFHSP